MPRRTLEDVNIFGVSGPLGYDLVLLDKDGQELEAPGGGSDSDAAAEALETEPITDVFVFSHGWLTDLEDALRSYETWLRAAAVGAPARDRLETLRAGFRPLLIGLHWPSMPGGREDPDDLVDYGSATKADRLDGQLGWACETPSSRDALSSVVESVARHPSMDPTAPPHELVDALQVLVDELLPEQDGPAGAPGADIGRVDPEQLLAVAAEQVADESDAAVSYGGLGDRGAAVVSRVFSFLSFWKMKRRACTVGEQGGASLLTTLHQSAARDVRIHLIGHSFGAIVVTAALAGALKMRPSMRRAHSMVLLQGAMSLWSFAAQVRDQHGRSGYFHPVLGDGLVTGPLVTTQSKHDYVLQQPYRLAAWFGGQVDFRPALPLYGAVGQYGIAGVKDARSEAMAEPDTTYDFACGTVYNLEASAHISKHRKLGPFKLRVDAHSHLTHPAVAHAIWSAALTRCG
jgi:hypothetical protein